LISPIFTDWLEYCVQNATVKMPAAILNKFAKLVFNNFKSLCRKERCERNTKRMTDWGLPANFIDWVNEGLHHLNDGNEDTDE
jgi:hypothetical protein